MPFLATSAAQPADDELKHWLSRNWPMECLQYELLFHRKYARLFPLIPGNYPNAPSGSVETTAGHGRLLSVSERSVWVLLDTTPTDMKGVRAATEFRPWQVWPA